MKRSAVLPMLLALNVALAGCGLLGQETDVRDLPAPEATDTEGPFGGASTPPGGHGSGVTDVDALLSAHSSTLNGSSVTVSFRTQLTVNGTGQNVSLVGKVLPDEDRGWMEIEFEDGVGTYYTVDGTTYYREVVNASAAYGTTNDISAIPEEPRFGADDHVRTAIAAAEWEPVGTVERDGRTLVEFRAAAVDPPDVNASENPTISSAGRLLVDQRGVVHHVSVATTVETDRGTVQYALSVSYTDIGTTTVEEPDWFENAEGS